MTKYDMTKWRITIREEEVSDYDWKRIRQFLNKNNIKYIEYRVV
jgi:hypothetical protein